MWLLYAFGHILCLALVNYVDEYLTANNKVSADASIHRKIGGLLLISTLMGFLGASVLYLWLGDVSISQTALLLAMGSAIPMVILFASYFYLLTLYPAYLVVPLFLLSSLWMLCIEFVFGTMISLYGVLGIFALMFGAYILDAGELKWKIPTKLLLVSLPATGAWAIALFMVRIASESATPVVISFWQLLGIGFVGVVLFLGVRAYRVGFLYRIKTQGVSFLGVSLFNEGLSQVSYVLVVFAVALAPVTTYVSAIGGLQGLVLLGLFTAFPQKGERTKITRLHVVAIAVVALGVFLIEMSY